MVIRQESLWSGQRGSNSPHPAWEAGALPNELYPHFVTAFGRLRGKDKSSEPRQIRALCKHRLYMAGMAGFGPAHEGVKVPCLSTWLHPKIGGGGTGPYHFFPHGLGPLQSHAGYGAARRARTDDLLITNQLHYQLSYSSL